MKQQQDCDRIPTKNIGECEEMALSPREEPGEVGAVLSCLADTLAFGCISNFFLRDTSMRRSSVVGDTHVEANLLSGHHLWVPDVTDHSCSLATVAVHPRWGGEGAIQETPFSSFTSVHPSYAAGDGPKFAASGVPQDSTFVTKLPANHSCFLLAPIIVADGLTFLENIPLCLAATSNKASPVLTSSLAQF